MSNTEAARQVRQMISDAKADKEQFAVLDAIEAENAAINSRRDHHAMCFPEMVHGGDGPWNNFGGDYEPEAVAPYVRTAPPAEPFASHDAF